MKKRVLFMAVLALLATFMVSAQRGGGGPERGGTGGGAQRGGGGQERGGASGGSHQGNFPRANQGHIPPPPTARSNPRGKPEVEKDPGGRPNGTPHVNNDHWYGHDKPNDARYHVAKPFEHGRFEKFGPTYRYNIERFDPGNHRFWLPGGFYFDIASWDWPICANWCWDCGDDYTIYEDPDHIGWYLLYNIHTGVYVHVTYMGT